MNFYTIEIAPEHLDLWAEAIFPRLVEDAGRIVRDPRNHLLTLVGPGGEGPCVIERERLGFAPKDKAAGSAFVLPSRPTRSGREPVRHGATAASPRYARLLRLVMTLARWHGGDAVRILTDDSTEAWEEAAARVREVFGYPVTAAFVLGAPAPALKP